MSGTKKCPLCDKRFEGNSLASAETMLEVHYHSCYDEHQDRIKRAEIDLLVAKYGLKFEDVTAHNKTDVTVWGVYGPGVAVHAFEGRGIEVANVLGTIMPERARVYGAALLVAAAIADREYNPRR